MKTPEELNALRNEVETLNKKLAELNEEELRQVAGGETLSDDWESKKIYKAMFHYISMRDEFHAVYVYRSKGFQLDGADSMNIRALFKQIFGHEIEESQYFE